MKKSVSLEDLPLDKPFLNNNQDTLLEDFLMGEEKTPEDLGLKKLEKEIAEEMKGGILEDKDLFPMEETFNEEEPPLVEEKGFITETIESVTNWFKGLFD